jgi:hypothetical protein
VKVGRVFSGKIATHHHHRSMEASVRSSDWIDHPFNFGSLRTSVHFHRLRQWKIWQSLGADSPVSVNGHSLIFLENVVAT